MSLERLGLSEEATEADVRARYKALALGAHPDRGGSTEQFQELTEWRDTALRELHVGQTFAHYQSRLRTLREAVRGAVCPRCDGTGVAATRQAGFRTYQQKCRLCDGKGRLS